MPIVNNQETNEDDNVFYVDKDGQIHDAVIKSIIERDGLHYAELTFERNGQKKRAIEVPHNTSREKHSWNHPLSAKERETHYHPDFYGPTPEVSVEQESSSDEEKDYSNLEFDDNEGEENKENA